MLGKGTGKEKQTSFYLMTHGGGFLCWLSPPLQHSLTISDFTNHQWFTWIPTNKWESRFSEASAETISETLFKENDESKTVKLGKRVNVYLSWGRKSHIVTIKKLTNTENMIELQKIIINCLTHIYYTVFHSLFGFLLFFTSPHEDSFIISFHFL